MSIQYTNGDYVVVEQEKKHLVLVTQDDPNGSRGIIEHTRVIGENLVLEFDARDVLSCLGPDPKAGTVHGIRVEIWKKTLDTPLGECDFYYKPDKDWREQFMDETDKMMNKLRKWRVQEIAPVTLELRLPKGKNTTGYYHPYKGRDELDLIQLRPASDSGLKHVISHEFAHPIWQKLLTGKIRASWIKRYYSDVKVTEIEASDSKKLLEALLQAADVRDGDDDEVDVDEEMLEFGDVCMRWIQDYHYLRKRDIETLLATGNDKLVTKIWPTQGGVLMTDKEERLTPYANKNPEEFFAEAVALHYSGKLLPDDVEGLLEKTFAYLKSR